MTTHPDRIPLTDPPLLVQGQTWEEMTVGSAFRTASRPSPRPTWSPSSPGAASTRRCSWTPRTRPRAGTPGDRPRRPGLLPRRRAGHPDQRDQRDRPGVHVHGPVDQAARSHVGNYPLRGGRRRRRRLPSTGQRGVVTTRNSVRNQRGEDLLIYTPVRLIRGRGYQAPGEAL